MALRLYLDDCASSRSLCDLLRGAGHTVVTSADAGLRGEDDEVHFDYAIRERFALVTYNAKDFQTLARLRREAGDDHPGVIAIYQDNNPRRDMTDQDIVAAIAFLEQCSGGQEGIANGFHSLNAYRQ